MVAMSLPSVMPDFEGEVSHVVVAGNETLIFVKPSTWRVEWDKISAKLQDLSSSLEKVTSLSSVKSGEIYVVKTKSSLERSYIIRRPTPDKYSIYLIDKGMQCETHFGEIYEIPAELQEFGVFSCVCPVLVKSAEQMDIYKAFVGHKCKCIVESVSRSVVVMGYVRGQLLVENGGLFEDLQDIVSSKTAKFPATSALVKFNGTADKDGVIRIVPNAQAYDSSSSSDDEPPFHRTYTHPKTGPRANANTRPSFSDRREIVVSKKDKRTEHFENRADAEFAAEYDKMKAGTLFTQTAYKQYEPAMLPTTVSVRFDKKDRTMNTFWVVNKKVFSAVEKALKDSYEKISHFPSLRRRGGDVQVRATPCLVRARADSPFKALYRAVPAQYDMRTKRFSIFLVDFGWFKWVLASDIIDISSLDKSDPIVSLPVAMIHCREDVSSPLHLKDLSKGTNCDIIIKNPAIRDVYAVQLVEPPSAIKNPLEGVVSTMNGQANGRENIIGNMRETEIISSCNRLVTETCQRQLMTSMIMETLSIASRELAQQPQNFWPNFPPFPMPVPMMMPMPFPVMWPMPIPSTNPNMQSTGHSNAVKPENNGGNGFEGGRFPESSARGRGYVRTGNNNRPQRFYGSGPQPAKEWFRSDFRARNAFGASGNQKNNKQMPRGSCDEGNGDSVWDLPSKSVKDRRTFQKSRDNNSQKPRLTSWEKAVAANRASRNQPDNAPDAP